MDRIETQQSISEWANATFGTATTSGKKRRQRSSEVAMRARRPRKRITDPSEKQFQSQVHQLAKMWHWEAYHTFDSRRSESGFPDSVLAKRGRIIFAELKVEPNVPTPAQLRWLAVLGLCPGVIARCWYPDDWPEIEAILTGMQT